MKNLALWRIIENNKPSSQELFGPSVFSVRWIDLTDVNSPSIHHHSVAFTRLRLEKLNHGVVLFIEPKTNSSAVFVFCAYSEKKITICSRIYSLKERFQRSGGTAVEGDAIIFREWLRRD
jgi:hypothetical protein